MDKKITTMKNSKVYEYPLNWVAVYSNGKVLKEFNGENSKNDFKSIEQKKVEYFGLYGKGNAIYFDKNGHFYYNNKHMDIEYWENGKIHKLTNNGFEKDLIAYKQMYVEYDRETKEQTSVFENISTGYKYRYIREDLALHVQFVIITPMSPKEKPYVEIKLTSNQDINGKLNIMNEKYTIDSIDAPLLKDTTGQINWTMRL